MRKALVGGKTDGISLDIHAVDQTKDWYYEMEGWDVQTGIPTRGKLEALGLGWVADEIGVG